MMEVYSYGAVAGLVFMIRDEAFDSDNDNEAIATVKRLE